MENKLEENRIFVQKYLWRVFWVRLFWENVLPVVVDCGLCRNDEMVSISAFCCIKIADVVRLLD